MHGIFQHKIKSGITAYLLLPLLSLNILHAQVPEHNQNPDSLIRGRLYAVIGSEIAVYSAGLSFLSFIWYKDHERVPFHFYNDGKGYLQMDKWGHAYTAYHESQSAYEALRWAGLSKKKALLYGGPVGIIFQTPIEVFDGLYEGWGFSWWDMLANTLGSVLFTTQEAFLDQQVVRMKFSYSPSGYTKYHPILGETVLESFVLDYNGHTQWLSGNLQSITGMEKIPPWLNLAFGYSGNGMIKEFSNPEYYMGEPFPHLERYRQYILSPDVDWSRIPTRKAWLRTLFRYMNKIKLPFPAIEYNRVDGLQFRGLYF